MDVLLRRWKPLKSLYTVMMKMIMRERKAQKVLVSSLLWGKMNEVNGRLDDFMIMRSYFCVPFTGSRLLQLLLLLGKWKEKKEKEY